MLVDWAADGTSAVFPIEHGRTVAKIIIKKMEIVWRRDGNGETGRGVGEALLCVQAECKESEMVVVV